jgi:hypothetical protein
MKRARVRLQPGKGLKVLTSSATVTPATTTDKAALPAVRISEGVVEGTLGPEVRITFEATLERKGSIEHGYITLAYDYTFPDQEVLQCIIDRANTDYPNDKMRDLLVKTIREGHPGKRSEGVTERVEFGPEKPK